MIINEIDNNPIKKQPETDYLDKVNEMLEAVRDSHRQFLDTLQSSPSLVRSQNTVEHQSDGNINGNTNGNAPTLTKRELQVITLLSEGLSKEKIAKQLDISKYTVATHARHLFKKLGVSNAPGAVGNAFRFGILKLDQ